MGDHIDELAFPAGWLIAGIGLLAIGLVPAGLALIGGALLLGAGDILGSLR